MENIEVSKNFDSLSKVHRALGIPAPLHPLASLIKRNDSDKLRDILADARVNFFTISYQTHLPEEYVGMEKTRGEGGRLLFISPNQKSPIPAFCAGTMGMTLLFHPLLLSGFRLAHSIERFDFFGTDDKGALRVTKAQSEIVVRILELLNQELKERIDDFSHCVIASQIELLLKYCNLFTKGSNSD